MAITDKKIGSWTNPVVNEADQPQRTAAEMKAIFDANSNQIKAAFNAVIDELVGTGGAGNVGNGALGEIPAGTVAAQLTALLNMFESYPSSSDIKGIRLSADNKIEVTLDGTTWQPTVQTGDPVTDLGALPVAADIQDTDGFLMYDASEMKNKRTLWSKIKEAIGTIFAAGTVGEKYTTTIEPDTADNAASIIRIKENATGNTRVLIAANTDANTGEVSQIVLRDGTNVGKINIQCNTSETKGIRIVDGNDKTRVSLRLGGMCGSGPCKRHPAADSDGRNPMDGLYKSSRTGNGKHPHQCSMAKEPDIYPSAAADIPTPPHHLPTEVNTHAKSHCSRTHGKTENT